VDLILRQIGRKGVREVTGKVPSAAHPEAEPVLNLDAIEHSHASAADPELLDLHAWHILELSRAFGAMGFNEAQILCAQASVINRLVEPVSEHALGAWLENVSSLHDLLGEYLYGKYVEGRFIGWATCCLKTLSHTKPIYANNKSRFLAGVRISFYTT